MESHLIRVAVQFQVSLIRQLAKKPYLSSVASGAPARAAVIFFQDFYFVFQLAAFLSDTRCRVTE
jgi:hypothetical protein